MTAAPVSAALVGLQIVIVGLVTFVILVILPSPLGRTVIFSADLAASGPKTLSGQRWTTWPPFGAAAGVDRAMVRASFRSIRPR